MKTRNTIKTALSIFILMAISLGFSQNNYLEITRSDSNNDAISYPPKTTFQLINEKDEVVFSDTSYTKKFVINKAYTLSVSPPYKNDKDTYYLTRGKLEIKSNADYFKAIEKHEKKVVEKNNGTYIYDEDDFTYGLSMKKKIEPSTLNPNIYNAKFQFNNGITVTFTDGEILATLNNEVLRIEGKYLIYSEFGLIKLSFRPSDGETWWVFEPVEK